MRAKARDWTRMQIPPKLKKNAAKAAVCRRERPASPKALQPATISNMPVSNRLGSCFGRETLARSWTRGAVSKDRSPVSWSRAMKAMKNSRMDMAVERRQLESWPSIRILSTENTSIFHLR